jgi:hypothetical protein
MKKGKSTPGFAENRSKMAREVFQYKKLCWLAGKAGA